ncbi:MAG: bifunctional lysylphosphatidylglycerol synthetase/lysine--tRNA ligase LysX [Jatrophihabitans sp.]|uniref:bifunctional lysylphosphatidylglycerol synthetase/lysine--tRNA ligase LysX n=1 Tax=Jatrophihabitans sp. TaxID=1932789 RepID=UPI003F7E902D
MSQDLRLPEPSTLRAKRGTARQTSGRVAAAQRDDSVWPARLAEIGARVLLAAAWWSVLRAFLLHGRRFDPVDDVFGVLNIPAGPSLFSAALLLVLAGAVRRRMRVAWQLLIGFQVLSAAYTTAVVAGLVVTNRFGLEAHSVAGVVTGLNLGCTVLVTAMLVGARRAFTSSLATGSRTRAVVVLVGGLVLSTAASIALTLAFPARLSDTYHRVHWAVRVAFGVRPDRTDLGWRGQHGHEWVALLAGTMSALAVVAAVIVLLRSARAHAVLSAEDELTIRGLLDRHGERDSLGWFATRRDKAAVFSPRRDAAITRRVVANVSIASADPIGAPDAWPGAIDAWLAEARSHGWFPAVLAAGEEGARAYVRAGLRAIPMGDEAIIDCAAFSLGDPSMQPIRRAARRMRRLGYTITVRRHDELSADEMAELAACAERWRVDATERGFSLALGRLGDPLDGRSVAVLAHDREGRLRGLLSLVPWGRRGLSLDLMRRDRSSDNGLNEAMVAALVQHARTEWGVTRVSLNFAMFRGVFDAAERVGARPLVRLTSRAMRIASRYWQIESLYRTNARYQPRWVTRYLCYDSALTLARVGIAAGAAEGFLPWPGARPDQRDDARTVQVGDETVPLIEAVARQQAALTPQPAPVPRTQLSRLVKLERLRAAGCDPYPVAVERLDEIADVVRRADTGLGTTVGVAGRVRAVRDHGGVLFLVLQERAATVQVIVDRASVGEAHELARRTIDLGDLVVVTGELVRSRRGELSVAARSWRMAAKSLAPVPKLTPREVVPSDHQLRLVVQPSARQRLELRSAALGRLRGTLTEHGFVEVETPMLQAVHGGAAARPFVTRANATDQSLYLRIAPELSLKRLAVAGMPRVFELNRNFRNEGIDDTHNPEFTALEVYQAYADYAVMRELAQELIRSAARAMFGAAVAMRRDADGHVVEVDLDAPWRVVPVLDAVSAAVGRRLDLDTPLDEVRRACVLHGVEAPSGASVGTLLSALYERLVEPTTTLPTFYVDFPVETTPLARPHRVDPRLAERWDLVAWGSEVGTAYSELTDPVEQRRRLTEQSWRRAAGDPEAMELDESFLAALELGMPPTGGLGIGVDRLIMMLLGTPIRDTLAFPFPKVSDASRTPVVTPVG